MKRHFISILLLSIATVNALAAQKLSSKNKETIHSAGKPKDIEIPSPRTYQPFSLTILDSGRIDPKYTGLPIREIIAAVEKLTQLKKGEFETTSDFQKRRNEAYNSKLFGSLGLNDIYPFVADVKRQYSQTPFYYSYDPDRAKVSFSDASRMTTYNGIGGPNYSRDWKPDSYYTSTLGQDFAPNETYSASNAYGASVTVEKIKATEFGFATDNTATLTIENVQMEASRAANELPSLKALFLVKPREPYMIYNFIHGDPTRTKPTEFFLTTKSLFVDVVAVIFFSGKTGEIIAKTPGLTPAKESVAETQ